MEELRLLFEEILAEYLQNMQVKPEILSEDPESFYQTFRVLFKNGFPLPVCHVEQMHKDEYIRRYLLPLSTFVYL